MPTWLATASTEATAPPDPVMTATLGSSWPTGGGPPRSVGGAATAADDGAVLASAATTPAARPAATRPRVVRMVRAVRVVPIGAR